MNPDQAFCDNSWTFAVWGKPGVRVSFQLVESRPRLRLVVDNLRTDLYCNAVVRVFHSSLKIAATIHQSVEKRQVFPTAERTSKSYRRFSRVINKG